ncbi:type I-C CRISPR-associated protein Cas5c [Streptomyces nigrescens]|uniref:pre-crRNA processing endonuclease n=1 Tax=Streptomyces nigrescens TaxID=1920 RepID=A0A640TQ63_STRNI|nr:type I-C CRISPR-associated protein Cas5c [Streptomyces libani]WAU00031.1 type I-C CRISPR-associated protein Cas5c [Streptomyces libani subsp. libani]GFE25757.1 type I-C CRISPR-associated protein Cas5 [Streptomyces libani subsp. libani]GGV98958.1 type I-C CRISPR-associated protein Cas5 [Streptomyces libani subsp. libani]
MPAQNTQQRAKSPTRPLPIEVEVWGPLACFTRPELKVERLSYQTMTPSAARGLLETIFWKPEITYTIARIETLNPVEWISIRRNEVNNSIVTKRTVDSLRANAGYRYDVAGDRGQRVTVALRDVAYRIHAAIHLRPHTGGHGAKYRDQFDRRVKRGACYAQPHFGCREFAAFFGPRGSAQEAGAIALEQPPFRPVEELGLMLHDIEYLPGGKERYHWFRARLEDGVLHVPARPLPSSQTTGMPGAESRATAEGTA